MAQLTWEQYKFLSEYCIASYVSLSYTSLQTGSGPLVSATSYQLGVNTFATALHSIAASGADVAAQIALLVASPGGDPYALLTPLTTVFQDVFNLAGLPSTWITGYSIASWITSASAILPEPPTSSGGGGGGDPVTLEALALILRELLAEAPIVIQGERVDGYMSFLSDYD